MRKLCKLMSLILAVLTVLSGCTTQMNLPESNAPRKPTDNVSAPENTVSDDEAAVSEDTVEPVYASMIPISVNEENYYRYNNEEDTLMVDAYYTTMGVSADGFERLDAALQSLSKKSSEEILSQAEHPAELP